MAVSLDIHAWQVWLAVGILLAIAEVLGTQFVLLALGVAFALTALVTAVFDLGYDGQVLAAAIWSALLVPAFIVFYRKRMMPKSTQALVSDGLGIGETFAIVRRGERLGVKVQGDFYPVEMQGGGEPVENARVVITGWRSLTALVRAA